MRLAGLLLALPIGACRSGDAQPDVPRRTTILTSLAPAPIGPYSQAVVSGGTLHAAGQIGLDPATGQLVAGGIEPETRQALANLRAVLAAARFELADVVQVQVYLTDLSEYAAMNAVYAEAFAERPPARAVVGVAALPRGARVEIQLVAVRAR